MMLEYDKHLENNAKTVTAAEEAIEIKHKKDEQAKMDKMFQMKEKLAEPAAVVRNEPRDAAQLKKDREERKKRMQKLRQVARENEQVVFENNDGGISNLMLL